jgi:Holliday junction resolvasome RuvABC endonuclease subunit
VASILRLREPVTSEDANDALALAICHANHIPGLLVAGKLGARLPVRARA